MAAAMDESSDGARGMDLGDDTKSKSAASLPPLNRGEHPALLLQLQSILLSPSSSICMLLIALYVYDMMV